MRRRLGLKFSRTVRKEREREERYPGARLLLGCNLTLNPLRDLQNWFPRSSLRSVTRPGWNAARVRYRREGNTAKAKTDLKGYRVSRSIARTLARASSDDGDVIVP